MASGEPKAPQALRIFCTPAMAQRHPSHTDATLLGAAAQSGTTAKVHPSARNRSANSARLTTSTPSANG
jgi:hypothetical protein